MKKFLTFISLLFVLLLALVSCASKKPSEPVIIESTKTITKIQRDTVLVVKPDSSYYKAYVECRDGKPYIVRDSIVEKGKRISVPKVEIKNNYLQVKCKVDSAKIALKWWETNTTIQDPKIIYIPKVEYIEKPFRWYHKTLMWIGGIFLFLSAVGIVLKFTVKP